jgi:hypothetical protein
MAANIVGDAQKRTGRHTAVEKEPTSSNVAPSPSHRARCKSRTASGIRVHVPAERVEHTAELEPAVFSTIRTSRQVNVRIRTQSASIPARAAMLQQPARSVAASAYAGAQHSSAPSAPEPAAASNVLQAWIGG